MTDSFMRENIFLYPQAEICYGVSEAFVSHPCRFATAGFEVCGGNGLQLIVDGMREDAEGDDNYAFYVGLNDYTKSKVDTCITAVSDNEETYIIDLSEEEQEALYRRLDEEAKKVYGMSCEEILEEARRRTGS